MSHLRELYRAEQLPVFQNRMFATAEEARACTKGDICLVQDMRTGLIFNQAFEPELMQYDEHYQNEQAVSSIFRAHLQNVAQIIEQHFAAHSLIEVGCGKGYFLEHLQAGGALTSPASIRRTKATTRISSASTSPPNWGCRPTA